MSKGVGDEDICPIFFDWHGKAGNLEILLSLFEEDILFWKIMGISERQWISVGQIDWREDKVLLLRITGG